MPKKLKFSLIVFLAVLVTSISFTADCLAGGALAQSENTGLELIDQAWHAIYQNYVEPAKLDSADTSTPIDTHLVARGKADCVTELHFVTMLIFSEKSNKIRVSVDLVS